MPLRVALLAILAFDWSHKITPVLHVPTQISVKQQEDRMMVTEKKKWGGGAGRETINLSIYLILFTNPISLLYRAILREKTA